MGRGLPDGRPEGLTREQAELFVRANTTLQSPPEVPEIRLHLADEAHALWLKTEEELAELGLPPPFWAFAWAGGQGLARYVLDHPEIVRGRQVLDFASGSGLVAIAAVLAGAEGVAAADIDPFATAAIRLNARANDVAVSHREDDLVGSDEGWSLVLVGDVFYDRGLAARVTPWFDALRARGAEILVGDPGRAYLPKTRLDALARYEVPVSRALEDAEVKRTTVWTWT